MSLACYFLFILTTFSKARLSDCGFREVGPGPGDYREMPCSLGFKYPLRDQPVQIKIPTVYGLFMVCQVLR